MARLIPQLYGNILATLLTAFAAFFGIMNVLFSDRSGFADSVTAILYIIILYGLWSTILHWLWRTDRMTWVWWLMAPAAATALLMIIGDTFGLLWFALLVLIAALLGTMLGRALIRRRLL